MKSLTRYVPRNAPSKVEWKHLSNLKLADDDPTGTIPIDLIIGSDLYNRVLVNAHNGPIGQPGAIQSHFGWVLSGTTLVPNHVVHSAHVVNSSCVVHHGIRAHHVVAHCCSLEQELHKFWEIEEIPQSQHLSPDEKRCEEHFLDSHSRAPDGRYIVRLPFRGDFPIDIGESRDIAERRLMSLTRRLSSLPEVKKEYSEFMHEYEQLNHMKQVISLSGNVKITLLTGKSKVSPLKPMTVPRLELSAAVLLSRLIEFTRQTLKLDKAQVHCWTDSTVTLAWLSKHPANWKTFVAHRVADIQMRLPDGTWHYVSTHDKPADCASRGLLGNELLYQESWWHGPSWLALESEEWPQQKALPPSESQLELKPTAIHIAKALEPWDLASRYSWWPKLVRITAYIKRFIEQCRKKIKGKYTDLLQSKAITATEFSHARKFWLRTIQSEVFSSELHALQQNHSISSRSSILSLTPFLDSDQLIRVGGRLKHSQLPFHAKHPILLADHPITTMIIHYTHHISLHAGTQLTLAMLRQEFWIIKARSRVKSVIHRCVNCTRERAKVCSQLMGQLPSSRVTAPSRAFQHCGIDYAGPVATRASGGRGITSRKAYIAVFICLATRAVHLELVSDYSTAAFLNAFLRFCARRGRPEVMYSDNGTTFAGADKELSQAYRAPLNDPDFLNRTASDNILWKFIPPHAPHFGGLWEAGVKSVKHHLRRVLGSHTLTFEEFTTVLCRIEACLNSRPLGPLTDSEEDYEFLTSDHFLIGSAVMTNPEPSILHLDENRLSRWQLLRQITERFWKQWQTDYINTLQQRVKWRKTKPPIQVGSIVLIQNPLLPPCKWELGRVTRCHTGSDGLVRVVSIKTAHSEYKRPITKVCLLPINIEADLKESVSSQA